MSPPFEMLITYSQQADAERPVVEALQRGAVVPAANDPPSNGQVPLQLPAIGALMVDTAQGERVGEFRGTAGPYWSLRPVRGGVEREADPARVRPAEPMERLRAETARANRRSRGELL